jgi:hypothetical protein
VPARPPAGKKEDLVSTPFIFIITHSIDEGKLTAYTEQQAEFARFVEANEPRLIGFHAHLNQECTEATFVFIFPDAAAADTHLQVAHEKIGQGLQITKIARIDVLGEPGPILQQALKRNADLGVPVSVKARPLAGVTRLLTPA